MISRRGFLAATGGCAAHLLLMSTGAGSLRRLYAAQPLGRVVRSEPWGRLEEVGPGMWALVSTPLAGERGSDSWHTVCNGGIIAGRSEVLLLEAVATPEGARWLAAQAQSLTGRRPTLGLVTHFHGDHCGGLAGYADVPAIPVRSTATTRELLQGKEPLPQATLPADGPATEIDLGGRVVRVSPRAGHTPSDLTVEVTEPHVVWCGDLVWNGMFPNYRDAIPSKKATNVRALLGAGDALFVPGHGALARRSDMVRYLALIDDVEAKARDAIAAGIPIEQAADAYTLPADVAQWTMFSPTYFRVAFQAWARELGAKHD